MTGLTFAEPLPGLGQLVDFELNPVPGAQGLFSLHALDAPERRLFLLDAGVFLPDYQPVISDAQAALIKASEPDEVATFVVANPHDGDLTVNLLAPIVVNNVTDVGAQVILEGQDYDIQHKLKALTPA